MRCPACQVDLNENISICPLCGNPSEDLPPRMEGVTYQDYPVCEYKRFQHNASLLYFSFSVIILLLAGGLELLVSGHLRYTPYVAFAAPCLWALLIRWRGNSSFSIGNFLLGVVVTMSPLLFWIGHRHQVPLTAVLSSGVAILTLGAVFVLLLATLLRRRHRERHLVYLLAFIVLSAVELGAAVWEGKTAAGLAIPAGALGLSLINLFVLLVFCGKTLWKEAKARFHF